MDRGARRELLMGRQQEIEGLLMTGLWVDNGDAGNCCWGCKERVTGAVQARTMVSVDISVWMWEALVGWVL